jgi:Ca2+-binding EF-hand superfamily protein
LPEAPLPGAIVTVGEEGFAASQPRAASPKDWAAAKSYDSALVGELKKPPKKKKRKKKRRKIRDPMDDDDPAHDLVQRKLRQPISGMSEEELQKAKDQMAPKEDMPVQEFKEMPPVQAIRHALLHRAGNLQAVFDVIDLNGDGTLDQQEFADGLSAMRIPWKELTGCQDVPELFSHFDDDNSGEVNLEEFLGFPEAMDDEWRKLPEQDQWKNYATKVKLTATLMTRPPKWESVQMASQKKDLERLMSSDLDPYAEEMALKKAIRAHGTEHPEVRKYRIGQLDDVEILRLRRQQQSQASDLERKLNHRMKELASIRGDLTKLKVSLYDITEGTEEGRGARAVKEKQANQNRYGVQGNFEKRRSLKGNPLASGMEPSAEELVGFFSETAPDLELSSQELEIREIARNLQIPIPDVEKVKKVFDKYDADGSGQIEKDEFKLMMTDLVCVGKLKGLEVPNGLLEDQWLSVDHDGSGEVDFDEFCEWYFFAYIPMMEKMEARGAVHKNLGKKRD